MAGGIKKFVVGTFDDEGIVSCGENVRKAGYKIRRVYPVPSAWSPDHAMGLRETSLHTAGFIYAITGTTTALTFISWVFTKDWPLDIGGKPAFRPPGLDTHHLRTYRIVLGRGYGADVLLPVQPGAFREETSFSSPGHRRPVC